MPCGPWVCATVRHRVQAFKEPRAPLLPRIPSRTVAHQPTAPEPHQSSGKSANPAAPPTGARCPPLAAQPSGSYAPRVSKEPVLTAVTHRWSLPREQRDPKRRRRKPPAHTSRELSAGLIAEQLLATNTPRARSQFRGGVGSRSRPVRRTWSSAAERARHPTGEILGAPVTRRARSSTRDPST